MYLIFYTFILIIVSTVSPNYVPFKCDVKVCTYITVTNNLPYDLTTHSLEMIRGDYPFIPARILSKTEEVILMKKQPFVAVGVAGVLHYHVADMNATVRFLNKSFLDSKILIRLKNHVLTA